MCLHKRFQFIWPIFFMFFFFFCIVISFAKEMTCAGWQWHETNLVGPMQYPKTQCRQDSGITHHLAFHWPHPPCAVDIARLELLDGGDERRVQRPREICKSKVHFYDHQFTRCAPPISTRCFWTGNRKQQIRMKPQSGQPRGRLGERR